jgi:dihydropteroate synthase
MQNNVFYTNKTLNVRGKLIDLDTPRVMGILNVTPDSFFDGGKFTNNESVLRQAARMLEEGADFIDVGGYSSRPGAADLTEDEEASRVMPVIRLLTKQFPEAILSIDTFRSDIVRQAVGAGASIVNDISCGDRDPRMMDTVASLQVPYVAMHMRGTPQTMTTLTGYEDVVKELIEYFHIKIGLLRQAGVKDIIVDPGFGFAKNPEQSFTLLRYLDRFKILGLPMLAGLSRKSMIWKSLDISPEEALNGTTSLNTIALLKGASVLRVHDVREAVQCIRLVQKLNG